MAGTREAGALRRALLWLLLVAALAWGLGSYALLDPDEGRNAEVAREMAAGGDFVLPRLDGLPYLDKPVLFFAADALCQRLLGAGETAARLPSLLFALATAALTGWFAGRLFGRRARWIAALAALAAPLPIAFARTVIFDSMLAFFVVLALCAFYLAIEARAAQRGGGGDAEAAPAGRPAAPTPRAAGDGAVRRPASVPLEAAGDEAEWPAGSATPGAAEAEPERPAAPPGYRRWTALAWAAIGLGVLTKGPVALAVPLLAAVSYAAVRRASRAVWHPLGPALLLLFVGPWIWAVSRQVPEFLHYALVTETWQRVTTPEMNREGPIWFFIPCLLAGALPWSVLAVAGWRRSLRPRGTGGRLDPPQLYLVLWIALPLVLFSLSHSKRPQYILPLLPAVALMAAKVWVDAEEAAGESPRALPGARAAAGTWLGLGALSAAAAGALPQVHVARLEHATLLPPTLVALALAFLVGAVLVALGGRSRPPAGHDSEPRRPGGAVEPRRSGGGVEPSRSGGGGLSGTPMLVAGLVLPMAALPALLLPLLDEIGSHRSSRGAAAAIAPHLAAGAEVVAVHAFPPSLPFYLRRTLLVATTRGRELTSNYVIAYVSKWLAADPRRTPLRPADWWRTALAVCDRPLVFVTWADDAADRATLAAAGLPLIVANDRMAAYGPCAAHPGKP